MEAIVRSTVDRTPRWYAAARQRASRRPVDVLFVGNSRTMAAVPVPAFENAASSATGRKIGAFNLGLGWSTPMQHLLGLRNLFEANEARWRGSWVLVQSGGITTNAQWTNRAQPWILDEVLRVSDLPAFWRSSGTAFTDKIHLTLRLCTRPLALLQRRERFREFLLQRALPGLMGIDRKDPAPGEPEALPLEDDAPAAADDALAARRERLLRAAAEWKEWAPARLSPCEDSLMAAFADLAARHGARVAFFEVPLSSYVKARYSEPCRGFDAWAASRGIPVLRPDFTYTDDDLPDLSHLSAERAPEYAQALARAWAEIR